jgi:hypothetical protein
MRRLLVVGAAILTLLTGCHRPGVARLYETSNSEFYYSEAMEDYVLCGYAIDAVRAIVQELLAAPNNDAALTNQTVTSYAKYADRLRQVSQLTKQEGKRQLILDAADAADAYAAEVDAQNSYHVDVQPVVSASHEAFPGCNLSGVR